MNSDRYRYIKELGRGGSGLTQLVYDRHLGIKKVVKEVTLSSSEQVDAFLRETNTLKAVKHPGIPVITDQWIEGNTGFFVMDYCDGTRMDSYVRSANHLSVENILSLMSELTQIIAILHNSSPQIIHGDLKPENLIISPSGLHLLDFGTAYFENGCSNNSPALAITYGYASPSLLAGTNPCIESDLYAIGMIFFFMLTGHDVREFPGKAIGIEDFPEEYSDSLKEIFVKCLSGYHDISELITDITSCQANNSVNTASLIIRDIKDEIFTNPIKKVYSSIKKKFSVFQNNRSDYIRLEHTFLTDGGHILFALLIGLCIGLLFDMKYPVYGAESTPTDEFLPLSFRTEAGENILLKENCIFEDNYFPNIKISDRKLCAKGLYSILISVNSPEGKHYSRSFSYNKTSK